MPTIYTKPLYFLTIGLLLVACTHKNTAKSTVPTPLPPIQQQSFWQQSGCTLTAMHNGVHLSTNGAINQGMLRFKVALPPYLTEEPPRFFLYTPTKTPLPIVGQGQYRSFELLNTAYITKKMLEGQLYAQIRYRAKRTINTPSPRIEHALFPFHNFPQALLKLYKKGDC